MVLAAKVSRRTWCHLLSWTVAPLRWWRRASRLACWWGVDQAVLGQSAPRRSYRGPLPLLLLGHMDGVFLPYGSTHQLVEGLALERHEVLTDLGTEPLPKQGRVLLIWVSVA
jgi:hypothetical protein